LLPQQIEFLNGGSNAEFNCFGRHSLGKA
jgi:hypothetical protein